MFTKHSVSTEVSVEGEDGVPSREKDENGSWRVETLKVG